MPPIPWAKVAGAVIAWAILWALSFLPWWQRLAILFGLVLVVAVAAGWLDERDRRRRIRAEAERRRARLALLRALARRQAR